MNLNQITLPVSNMDTATEFYRTLEAKRPDTIDTDSLAM